MSAADLTRSSSPFVRQSARPTDQDLPSASRQIFTRMCEREKSRRHGAPGRRSTYLVSRTVRLLECTLKTHLRGRYLRTALRIAVTRYMPMRWPVLPRKTEVSHHFYPCSLSSAPTGLAMDCLFLSGARYLREPTVPPRGAFRSPPPPIKMHTHPGALKGLLCSNWAKHSSGRHSSSSQAGNHSAMLSMNSGHT